MDIREKLVELLGADTCKHDCCEDCEYCEDRDACIAYLKNSMADHLIAHGVTVQEWISVKERFPHAEYEESDEVLTVDEHGIIDVLYFDGSCWCYPTGEVRYKGTKITHWMPLPQPPKGE